MTRTLIARRLVGRAYAALAQGDPGPALAAFAPHARFRFTGDHSWGEDTTDPEVRRSWFTRFAEQRPRLVIRDVLVAGPPWRTRLAVVFEDEIRDAAGTPVYRNRGVQLVVLHWGRIVLDEVHLDTQKVAAFASD